MGRRVGSRGVKGQPAMAQKWQPTKAVTLVVPAETGGGADQMARFIQGVVTKHKLTSRPMVVINKAGGAGAEGFLDVKASRGDSHKLVITLSNVFTTPLATGTPFSWKDITPVSMLALGSVRALGEQRRATPDRRRVSERREGGERSRVQHGRDRIETGR